MLSILLVLQIRGSSCVTDICLHNEPLGVVRSRGTKLRFNVL